MLARQRQNDAEILRIRQQITTPTQQETESKRETVALTQHQLDADRSLFSHRLRLLGLESRQEQIRREQASEQDLQCQEAVAARQTAIAEDLGRRATQIRRQNINDARQDAEEDSRNQLLCLRDLGTNLGSTFRKMNIALERDSMEAANGRINEVNIAAGVFTYLQNRIEAGIAR